MTDRESPILIDAGDADAVSVLAELEQGGVIASRVDEMSTIVEDLFRCEFPFVAPGSPEYSKTFSRYLDRHWNGGNYENAGVWAVFPWRGIAVHLPQEDEYTRLRTARNRFLIEDLEQHAFYHSRVAVAGLSVGLSVVTSLVLSGGPRHLRLADSDHLALPNLNRLAGSVCDLGQQKTDIAARKAWELNPFEEIVLFPEGLSDASMSEFFEDDTGGVDLFVEEMDDIRMKIRARFAARDRRIPVVMATDDGDNAIVDVERFDLEPDRPLFHGSIDEQVLGRVPDVLPMPEKVKLAAAIVGSEVTTRVQHSLQAVGTRLPTWPQLGNAATVCGAAVSYVARRIICGQEMPSGRYRVHLDSSLDPTYHSPVSVDERRSSTDDFERSLEVLFGKVA